MDLTSSQKHNDKRSGTIPHDPNMVIFACKYCGSIGADQAGKKRIFLPAQFRVITAECASRIEPDIILRAFADGIDGVAVFGCHLGGCRNNHANHVAAKRFRLLQDLLDTVGVGGNRFLVSWGTAHESFQFADTIHQFYNVLKNEPPLDTRLQSHCFNRIVHDDFETGT